MVETLIASIISVAFLLAVMHFCWYVVSSFDNDDA